MAFITLLSQEEIRNKILNNWLTRYPNANVAQDSQIYMDADALAQVIYMQQIDAFSLAEEAFVGFATGDRLSNLGLERGLPRKDAAYAIGIARFARSTLTNVNYTIPAGTQISTQPNTEGNTIVFATDVAATIYGTLTAPINLVANTASSGGSFGAGITQFYRVTAVDGLGNETEGSTETNVTTGSGSTNSNSLTWDAVANAVSYNIYVGSSTGTATLLTNTVGTYYVHTYGSGNGINTVPSVNNTGATSVDVAITAKNTGISGNVPAGAISVLVDQPAGIETVTNVAATNSGADIETDSVYRSRLQDAFIYGSSQSKTTVSGYEQTALSVPAVNTALVDIPTSGAYRNQFNIYITSTENNTGLPSTALISQVQAKVDSDENRSPNDVITVLSPIPVNIDVTVTITDYDTSYNLADLKDSVKQNVTDFINSLTTGQDVYIVDIQNAVHDTNGVKDFIVLTPTSNISISNNQKALAGTITIVS